MSEQNNRFLISTDSIYIPINENNTGPSSIFSNIFNVIFDSFYEFDRYNERYNEVVQNSMDTYNNELFKKIDNILIDINETDSEKELEDKICFICLENISQKIYKLPCNHIFHKNCLDQAISFQHLKCPLCKKDIPIQTINKEEYENENGHKISLFLK